MKIAASGSAAAAGRMIMFLFLAADIAMGVWIFRSYQDSKQISFTPGTADQYVTDVYSSSGQSGAGRKDNSVSGKNGSSAKEDPGSKETVAAAAQPAAARDADYSTEKRPEPEEFDWYVNDVYKNGIPVSASVIKDYNVLTGGWKAMIYYDIENKNNARSFDIMNMTLGGWEDDASLVIDWYRMYYEFEYEDETSWEDSVFTGSFNSGVLAAHMDNGANIFVKSFYEHGGKQYAVGYMDTVTGVDAVVAMVRP